MKSNVQVGSQTVPSNHVNAWVFNLPPTGGITIPDHIQLSTYLNGASVGSATANFDQAQLTLVSGMNTLPDPKDIQEIYIKLDPTGKTGSVNVIDNHGPASSTFVPIP